MSCVCCVCFVVVSVGFGFGFGLVWRCFVLFGFVCLGLFMCWFVVCGGCLVSCCLIGFVCFCLVVWCVVPFVLVCFVVYWLF